MQLPAGLCRPRPAKPVRRRPSQHRRKAPFRGKITGKRPYGWVHVPDQMRDAPIVSLAVPTYPAAVAGRRPTTGKFTAPGCDFSPKTDFAPSELSLLVV